MRRHLPVYFAALLLALFTAWPSTAAGEEETKPNRDRLLGDSAFERGDYQDAAGFYARFLRDAAPGRELIDAYGCLIAAQIRSGKLAEAEASLRDFEKKYPYAELLRRNLYRADILLMQSKYVEAEELLRSVLNGNILKGNLYFQLLSSLGFSLAAQKKWEQSAEVYALLKLSGADTEWEFFGFLQLLYTLIMGEKYDQALKLFDDAGRYRDQAGAGSIDSLRLLYLAKSGQIEEFKKTYPEISTKITRRPDALHFKILIIAAEKMLAGNDVDNAVKLYTDSFEYAPGEFERKRVMRKLINLCAEHRRHEEAIAMARKYLDFYKNEPDALEVRLQTGGLLCLIKDFDAAMTLYKQIISDKKLSVAQRLRAAGAAAVALAGQKKYREAESMLNFIYETGTVPDEKNEGRFLLGRLFFDRGNYSRAADIMMDLSTEPGKWREQALWWAMQALSRQPDYKAALDIADELIALKKPEDLVAGALYHKAFLLGKMGKPSQARDAYLTFIRQYPKTDLVSAALFEAAETAYGMRDFSGAITLYHDFAARFPRLPAAADALYKSIFAKYFLGDYPAAQKTVERLEKEYPGSPFTAAAMFWEADWCRTHGDPAKAGLMLEKIIKAYPDDRAIQSQALFSLAETAEQNGDPAQAMQHLKTLFEKYPGESIISDAYYLAGNILSQRGDYPAALVAYGNAAQRRPNSGLEMVCLGRMGDCSQVLYGKNFDSAFLKKAGEYYEKLLDKKNFSSPLRNQTLYKLGKICELMKDNNKALEKYNELVFSYPIDKKQSPHLKPVWTVKAAYAAVALYLRDGTPESAAKAVKIYRMLDAMHLDTGENFTGKIEELKTKYQLTL